MAGMTDFQREEVARMESRAHSCEARFESLHLDEIDWKKERKQLRVDLAAAIKERDEWVELYKDLLRRLSGSAPPRASFLSGDAREKEGGGA
jgi:hypothetical protein